MYQRFISRPSIQAGTIVEKTEMAFAAPLIASLFEVDDDAEEDLADSRKMTVDLKLQESFFSKELVALIDPDPSRSEARRIFFLQGLCSKYDVAPENLPELLCSVLAAFMSSFDMNKNESLKKMFDQLLRNLVSSPSTLRLYEVDFFNLSMLQFQNRFFNKVASVGVSSDGSIKNGLSIHQTGVTVNDPDTGAMFGLPLHLSLCISKDALNLASLDKKALQEALGEKNFNEILFSHTTTDGGGVPGAENLKLIIGEQAYLMFHVRW
jgi:hypothetical protein